MYKKYVEPAFMPTRAEMLALIEERINSRLDSEIIPSDEALDRVCAEDTLSENTLPNKPAGRFDGIGVRFADFENGLPDTSCWLQDKEYYFSNTGVVIRDGYDTVIIIEDIDIEDGRLIIHKAPKCKGEYVMPVGWTMKEGEALVPEGKRVSPAHIGLLAAGGVKNIKVLKKPVVTIIPTGNELVSAYQATPPGKNVESNSHMLSAYLRLWGAEPRVHPIVQDNLNDILTVMRKAVAESDMVLILAGASKGTMDFTMDVLAQVGDVLVKEMGHGPGRHSTLTLAGDKPVVGVAGPSYGARIFAELYLHAIVNKMLRQPYEQFVKLTVTLDNEFNVHEVDFCERVNIVKKADGYHASKSMDPNRTLAQTVNSVNGNFYRSMGSGYHPGDKAEVELLCARIHIPEG